MCRAYGLSPKEALEEATHVAAVVGGWKAHFKRCGVPKPLIDQYARQIDRPVLLQQRQQLKA
jgi:hypothetical protein